MTPADKVKFEDLDREMEDFTKTMTTEDKAAFKELKPKTVNEVDPIKQDPIKQDPIK